MNPSTQNHDNLAHAIAKIIQADDETIEKMEDGIVKSEIISIRGDIE
jgi:hypothetical protein